MRERIVHKKTNGFGVYYLLVSPDCKNELFPRNVPKMKMFLAFQEYVQNKQKENIKKMLPLPLYEQHMYDFSNDIFIAAVSFNRVKSRMVTQRPSVFLHSITSLTLISQLHRDLFHVHHQTVMCAWDRSDSFS